MGRIGLLIEDLEEQNGKETAHLSVEKFHNEQFHNMYS
jgi:hypothetical protein